MRVNIEDTGPGISAQDQAHIFEWFYQGQAPGGKGSGMGLALSLGLTRLHQGQLTFRSQPGQGTTLVVTLPLVLPEGMRSAVPVSMPVAAAFTLDEDLAETLPDAAFATGDTSAALYWSLRTMWK